MCVHDGNDCCYDSFDICLYEPFCYYCTWRDRSRKMCTEKLEDWIDDIERISWEASVPDEVKVRWYADELEDYISAVHITALSIKSDCAVMDGVVLSDAQMYYMVAKGKTLAEVERENSGEPSEAIDILVKGGIPAGVTMNDTVKTALSITDNAVVAYEIEKDSYVERYSEEKYSFYSKANGTEKHYVTSDGIIFVLPGFPLETDEGTKHYITPYLFYTGEPITDLEDTDY